jgi:hypothetical protein
MSESTPDYPPKSTQPLGTEPATDDPNEGEQLSEAAYRPPNDSPPRVRVVLDHEP